MFVYLPEDFKSTFDVAGSDKSSLHGYEEMYADVFSSFHPSTLLEIGILKGNSLVAWNILFPSCKLTGVDIRRNLYSIVVEKAREFELLELNSTRDNVKHIFHDKRYDIIIDDGSHIPEHQLKTFNNLADCWNTAYVIEDIWDMDAVNMLQEKIRESYPNLEFKVWKSKLTNVPFHKESTNSKVLVDFYAMSIKRV